MIDRVEFYSDKRTCCAYTFAYTYARGPLGWSQPPLHLTSLSCCPNHSELQVGCQKGLPISRSHIPYMGPAKAVPAACRNHARSSTKQELAYRSGPNTSTPLRKITCRVYWLLKGILTGSFKGDISMDIDVELDVDKDRHFGRLKEGFQSVQERLSGIEAVMVPTLIILK